MLKASSQTQVSRLHFQAEKATEQNPSAEVADVVRLSRTQFHNMAANCETGLMHPPPETAYSQFVRWDWFRHPEIELASFAVQF